MGTYINPQGASKEQFLAQYGSPLTKGEFSALDFDELKSTGAMAVIHVNNGPFTAAAVADTPSELVYWQTLQDPRPTKYYMVDIEHLKPFLH